MKAVIILLSVLLVLAHPAAVAAVLSVEAVVCSALGWLTWRGLSAVTGSPDWRRAAR